MPLKVIPNTPGAKAVIAEADLEAKTELFQAAHRAFAQPYEPGDFRRYPWLNRGLCEVESKGRAKLRRSANG